MEREHCRTCGQPLPRKSFGGRLIDALRELEERSEVVSLAGLAAELRARPEQVSREVRKLFDRGQLTAATTASGMIRYATLREAMC